MKLTKNAKNKQYEKCPYCGAEGLFYWHHVYGASNKKKSEKYGAVIFPCDTCHTWDTDSIHKQPSQHKNKELKDLFRQLIMDDTGMTVEEFIDIFGRSYLLEV